VLGVTFVTYSGHFVDMSVPCIMAFSGIMAVQLLPLGLAASIAGAILSGSLIGAINASWSAKAQGQRPSSDPCPAVPGQRPAEVAYTGNQIYPDAVPART